MKITTILQTFHLQIQEVAWSNILKPNDQILDNGYQRKFLLKVSSKLYLWIQIINTAVNKQRQPMSWGIRHPYSLLIICLISNAISMKWTGMKEERYSSPKKLKRSRTTILHRIKSSNHQAAQATKFAYTKETDSNFQASITFHEVKPIPQTEWTVLDKISLCKIYNNAIINTTSIHIITLWISII